MFFFLLGFVIGMSGVYGYHLYRLDKLEHKTNEALDVIVAEHNAEVERMKNWRRGKW